MVTKDIGSKKLQSKRFKGLFRRFGKQDDGATMVEFAIVAGPFFLLIFSIIETSIFFFASQYLENSVDEVTRKLRTGQLKDIKTAKDFKEEFCKEINVLFDCETGLKVRVETAAKFEDLSKPPEPNEKTGELNDADYYYQKPGPQEIVQVTATYLWPIYTNYSAPLTKPGLSGAAVMHATNVVRTEPFE
ncbi:MAG: pilus assembly protein [Rhizobiaceae bacterium]|jgi:Flp pilus assembly protein TadG|nr:pilus assembly protein [Rhizobiaceae bacterium]